MQLWHCSCPPRPSTLAAQQDYFSNWPAGRSPQEVGKARRRALRHQPAPAQSGHHLLRRSGHLVRRAYLRPAHARHRSARQADQEIRSADARRRRRGARFPSAITSTTPSSASFRSKSPFRPRTRSISTTGYPSPTGNGTIRSPTASRTRRATGSTTCTCSPSCSSRPTAPPATRSISTATPTRWSPTSTSCSSPTASSITRPTCPSSGAAATAGSPPAWRRCCATLPADHPQRARIMAGYKLMMAALLKYQDPDGMWRQLIDHAEAWEETLELRHVHLRADHRRQERLARRGHLRPRRAQGAGSRVAGFIDQNNDVTNVCEGTNKTEQSRLLPRAQAPNRRLPRPGAGAVGGVGAAALGRNCWSHSQMAYSNDLVGEFEVHSPDGIRKGACGRSQPDRADRWQAAHRHSD